MGLVRFVFVKVFFHTNNHVISHIIIHVMIISPCSPLMSAAKNNSVFVRVSPLLRKVLPTCRPLQRKKKTISKNRQQFNSTIGKYFFEIVGRNYYSLFLIVF